MCSSCPQIVRGMAGRGRGLEGGWGGWKGGVQIMNK